MNLPPAPVLMAGASALRRDARRLLQAAAPASPLPGDCWDRILNLELFPEEVLETETAFYRKVQNECSRWF